MDTVRLTDRQDMGVVKSGEVGSRWVKEGSSAKSGSSSWFTPMNTV